MKTLIALLLASQFATAEEWFCTKESGKREGDIIWSCGIGEATDEASARHLAFKDAEKEFNHLCDMSSDCIGRKITVDPQRTTCAPYNAHIKCYRLLVITLGM